MTYAEHSGHLHYVTLRRGSRTAVLLGPYATRQEAERHVDRAHQAATRIDPWAGFDASGTSRVTLRPGRAVPTGCLNERIGLV